MLNILRWNKNSFSESYIEHPSSPGQQHRLHGKSRQCVASCPLSCRRLQTPMTLQPYAGLNPLCAIFVLSSTAFFGKWHCQLGFSKLQWVLQFMLLKVRLEKKLERHMLLPKGQMYYKRSTITYH